MAGVRLNLRRNDAKQFMEGSVAKIDKYMAKGVGQSLAYLQDYHKTKSIRRGGGKPKKNRWTTRSGELRRSFHISHQAGNAYGSYGSDHWRSKVLEEGMTIKARNAPYLRFKTWDGRWHRVKEVTIPPRPTLQHAVDKTQKKRDKIMQSAADEGML